MPPCLVSGSSSLGLAGLFGRVERLEGRAALALAQLVDVVHVVHLDLGAVLEHQRAQIARGRRR